jgi:hypothetical protein
MPSMKKLVLPLLTMATIVMLASALSGPSAGTDSPYLSALSDLAASPVLAAGGCGNRACDFTQFRTCYTNSGTRCDRNVRTAAGCATIPC